MVDDLRTSDQGIRHGLLLRATLDVLAASDDPLPSDLVLREVAETLQLNAQELSRNKTGNQRFDTFIRFATGWMKAIGWMEKTRALGWSLTSEGLQAAEELSPDELYRVSRERYSEVLRARKAKEGRPDARADARWDTVREAVDAIPAGSWTAYKDLADLVGLPPQSIGSFVAGAELATGYRVLQVDGGIAPEFSWNDPSRTDDPRALLESEGVEFDQAGRAAKAQRITSEELREIIGVPGSGPRAWLVRGSAVSGMNVVFEWLDEGFVSLAAAHLRRLEAGVTLETLRQAVETDYAHLTYNQRKTKLAELHAFLNRMVPGNIILTTSEGHVYLGRITGEPYFTDSDDSRTNIRRKVTWYPGGVDFSDLGGPLQARLKSSSTVVDLTDIVEDVEALLGARIGTAPVSAVREATLPNLSAEKTEELLVGAEWLTDFVDLLRDRRQVILHGPPGTGKTFLALSVAEALTDPSNVRLVQFHPSYSYEDFFEGYRPTPPDDSGRVGFALSSGPLREIVDDAQENPGMAYILIIDEINRANLAKVFGELYFLLEYRDRAVRLMYAPDRNAPEFTLPKNVYIVGTMNTADRSITPVDAAMRRRFAFLSLHPDDTHVRSVLRSWLAKKGMPTLVADLLDALNARIADRDFKVGPSYLMRPDVVSDAGMERIWRTAILPLLDELHYGDPNVDVAKLYGLPALRRAVTQTAGPAPDGGAAPGGLGTGVSLDDDVDATESA